MEENGSNTEPDRPGDSVDITQIDETEVRGLDSADETSPEPADEPNAAIVVNQDDPFVGRWNRLISTTNWEKGRIIHDWRASLIAVNAPVTEYSDEMWSQMVGGTVSGQHAGRLRRVYERFGDVYDQYDSLFWSHFQAALDWDDAEMWLEGAVQNRWSVSGMRKTRWEANGGVAEDQPASDAVNAEVDEDYAQDANPNSASSSENDAPPQEFDGEARSPAGPDFGDEDEVNASASGASGSASPESDSESSTSGSSPTEESAGIRPLADLPSLPEDLSEAFESFQLAILRHKGAEWTEVSCDDVLASLDALKALALAESE